MFGCQSSLVFLVNWHDPNKRKTNPSCTSSYNICQLQTCALFCLSLCQKLLCFYHSWKLSLSDRFPSSSMESSERGDKTRGKMHVFNWHLWVCCWFCFWIGKPPGHGPNFPIFNARSDMCEWFADIDIWLSPLCTLQQGNQDGGKSCFHLFNSVKMFFFVKIVYLVSFNDSDFWTFDIFVWRIVQFWRE